MIQSQSTNLQPNHLDYTRAMLPGLLIGSFLYWLSLFASLFVCSAITRGKLTASLFATAGFGLIAIPIAVFIVGLLVRLLLCVLNKLFGNPICRSTLAICVSGLTYYLLTAWVPLIYLLDKKDGPMFLLTVLHGPILGMTCGSVTTRLYERNQYPYIRCLFQFQLRHLFILTFLTAVLAFVSTQVTASHLVILYPAGYCLIQIGILLLLPLLPPVKKHFSEKLQ